MKNEKTTGQTPDVFQYLEMLEKGEYIKRLKSNQREEESQNSVVIQTRGFKSFKERVMSSFKDF